MNSLYIKFNSITYAQKAQEMLRSYGINTKISRNINPKRQQGCNYVLYVPSQRAYESLDILNENGVKNLGLERGDGT